VPLYVLYPPGGGGGEVLPQILTQGGVLAALDRLGG
jgi:thiol:disulfide interchange protein